jgi:hypothetical protein
LDQQRSLADWTASSLRIPVNRVSQVSATAIKSASISIRQRQGARLPELGAFSMGLHYTESRRGELGELFLYRPKIKLIDPEQNLLRRSEIRLAQCQNAFQKGEENTDVRHIAESQRK